MEKREAERSIAKRGGFVRLGIVTRVDAERSGAKRSEAKTPQGIAAKPLVNNNNRHTLTGRVDTLIINCS